MKKILFPALILLILTAAFQSDNRVTQKDFISVVDSAKPWVYWYWMHGAVTKEAISADLEAMKEAGLGGAYIFAIKDTTSPPLFEPSVRTMSPEWWQMVKHAMSESERLGLKLGINSCDGFTAAGGGKGGIRAFFKVQRQHGAEDKMSIEQRTAFLASIQQMLHSPDLVGRNTLRFAFSRTNPVLDNGRRNIAGNAAILLCVFSLLATEQVSIQVRAKRLGLSHNDS